MEQQRRWQHTMRLSNYIHTYIRVVWTATVDMYTLHTCMYISSHWTVNAVVLVNLIDFLERTPY